jgi:hypothetical protein
MGAVGADGFVEGLAGDAELVRPEGDVRGELGVDLFRVMGGEVGFGVGGVRGAGFGLLDFFVLVGAVGIGLGHGVPLL